MYTMVSPAGVMARAAVVCREGDEVRRCGSVWDRLVIFPVAVLTCKGGGAAPQRVGGDHRACMGHARCAVRSARCALVSVCVCGDVGAGVLVSVCLSVCARMHVCAWGERGLLLTLVHSPSRRRNAWSFAPAASSSG